jgi:hypothetical protein
MSKINLGLLPKINLGLLPKIKNLGLLPKIKNLGLPHPYFWRENLIGFECRYGPQLVVIVGLVLRILGVNGLLSAFEWLCLVY